MMAWVKTSITLITFVQVIGVLAFVAALVQR